MIRPSSPMSATVWLTIVESITAGAARSGTHERPRGDRLMGYPMTYQRVIRRNRIEDGDYSKPPSGRMAVVEKPVHLRIEEGLCGFESQEALETAYRNQFKMLWDQRNDWERSLENLCGDLRRLERDAQDEKATCHNIAFRTGLNVELVAAVLKEFIQW